MPDHWRTQVPIRHAEYRRPVSGRALLRGGVPPSLGTTGHRAGPARAGVAAARLGPRRAVQAGALAHHGARPRRRLDRPRRQSALQRAAVPDWRPQGYAQRHCASAQTAIKISI